MYGLREMSQLNNQLTNQHAPGRVHTVVAGKGFGEPLDTSEPVYQVVLFTKQGNHEHAEVASVEIGYNQAVNYGLTLMENPVNAGLNVRVVALDADGTERVLATMLNTQEPSAVQPRHQTSLRGLLAELNALLAEMDNVRMPVTFKSFIAQSAVDVANVAEAVNPTPPRRMAFNAPGDFVEDADPVSSQAGCGAYEPN